MRDVHITVEVELRRSDGNYGSDRAMVQLSATLDEDEDLDFYRDSLLSMASADVEATLLHSASLEVRRTMLRKPRLCNECREPLADDITGYLHPSCDAAQRERYQRQREEQNARWAQEREARELASVSATTLQLPDDQDDDDDDDPEHPL